MDGSFPSAPTARVPTAFFCNRKGGLQERLDSPDVIEDPSTLITGDGRTSHIISIYTYQHMSTRN